jgi:hypothetical protein
LDLLLKDFENAAWGVAALELGSERVRAKILFRTLFVRFQGIIENQLKIGGWGGSRVSVRHRAKDLRDEETSCEGGDGGKRRATRGTGTGTAFDR